DGGLIAQIDDAAEDRNPAMLRIRRVERRYLEGRFHRKDFGIVTVVEKSDLSAAGKGEQPAFQTTCAPIVGDQSRGRGNVLPEQGNYGKCGKRVRDHAPAGHSQSIFDLLPSYQRVNS